MYFVMSTVSVGSFQKQVPLHIQCRLWKLLWAYVECCTSSLVHEFTGEIYVTHKVLSKIRSVDHL